MRYLAVLVVFMTVLAACGADVVTSDPSTTITSTIPETTVATTEPSNGATDEPVETAPTTAPWTGAADQTTVPPEPVIPDDVPPGLTDTVALAVNDLAAKLGVPADSIVVVEVAEVIWRDSSLGCPQEGMSYLQVLVDGGRIILEVDGDRYHYHSGRDAVPFLCENPQKPAEGGGGNSDT